MTQGKKRGGIRKSATGNQKKSKRSDFKFPYLEPECAMHRRKEETQDLASYVNQLNDEEKAWLNQFAKEYINADTSKPIFHTTAAEKKICNDKNNARNRCDYTRAQGENRLNLVENDYEMERLIHSEMRIDEEIGDDQ